MIIISATELNTHIDQWITSKQHAFNTLHVLLVSCLVAAKAQDTLPLKRLLSNLPPLTNTKPYVTWVELYTPIVIKLSADSVKVKLRPNRTDTNWQIDLAMETAPWTLEAEKQDSDAAGYDAIVKRAANLCRKGIEAEKFTLAVVADIGEKILLALRVNPPKAKVVAAADVATRAPESQVSDTPPANGGAIEEALKLAKTAKLHKQAPAAQLPF